MPSLQIVFGNEEGAIDWSIPTQPVGSWKEPWGTINDLAVLSGLYPDAYEEGIPEDAYKARDDEAWWSAFLADLCERSRPFDIVVKTQADKHDPSRSYSKFGYLVTGEEE